MFALFIALECGKTTYKYNIRIKKRVCQNRHILFFCLLF